MPKATALADVHPTVDLDLLRQLADGVRSDRIGSEDATRALCQVFEDTFTFEVLHGQLNSDLKAKVSAFLSGTPADDIAAKGFDFTPAPLSLHRHPFGGCVPDVHKKHHLFAGRARAKVEETIDTLEHRPIVYEDHERAMIMEVYADIPFLNWQQNVQTRPSLTFVPSTVLSLQNLIKTYPHRRIRCSGYRHTRSDFFVEDGDILVSFVSLHYVASVLPEMISMFSDRINEAELSGELRSVQTFPPRAGQPDTQRVRVGVAVTPEELREWAIADGWSLPVDVTADEVTTGGIVGSMCHGSGFAHKSINDYIRSVEYVDVNGVVQSITDAKELHAALGCFGLMGIITHITYEVKKMTFAVMQPRKITAVIVGTDLYPDIPARWQCQILATGNMAVLSPLTTDPEDLTIKTKLPNALHFRRGRHYARSRNMEIELPIPPLATDNSKPDWLTVRKAWWGAVNLVYSSANSPMRLAMDMRITGDSDIIMAPQRGNSHGTVALEIGSVTDTVTEEEWQTFCQSFVDMLTALAPEGKLRPHWGKEWEKMRFGGLPAREYIRTSAYKTEIPECLAMLQKIGKRQGWTLNDLNKRFSNKLLDDLFFHEPSEHA
ncbi:hypothetical protein D6D01_03971 [Aureobasidium pullulans]|uniref:FAD linked oxidase N-terminal domain-containing protein n=1 Tax=Aureobasidium pullulans TaxID=5580 RepID=A0A4S9LH14_AURPU|nr:hypothetical protein D6D01_03971 [Aureobasidium pullulans]